MRRSLAAVLGLNLLIVPAALPAPASALAPVASQAVASQAIVPQAAVSQAMAAGPVEVPDTPVGQQVTWLIEVTRRLPISQTEAAQHLSPAFLALIDLAQLNQSLAAISGPTGLTLRRYQELSGTSARFLAGGAGATWLGGVAVDATGLITSLTIVQYADAPASWAELDRRLHAVAPRVSLLVARLDERESGRDARCTPVHAVAAGTVRPLGSAFKLYVLGALANEVRAGHAGWDEPLAIREDWKSLPSGVLQNLPAGTTLPLRAYADNMIAISDNTAADHLIHRVGREAVQRQQVRFGMREPLRNIPFLTTREFFTLKRTDYPELIDEYGRLPLPARPGYLASTVDPLPLPGLDQAASWTAPRRIDTVEWYASPADICRAFAGLARQADTPGLEPVGQVLARNDGGLWLDPAVWDTTWFKGGSEPGVLTLNYLARTGGQTFVVSVMASDPARSLDETAAAVELQGLIRGAFALAR